MHHRFILFIILIIGLYWESLAGIGPHKGTSQCQRHTLGWAEPRKAGFDEQKLTQVDTLLEEAIRDSAFPGGVLLVARNGKIVHHKGYGYFEYGDHSEKVDTNTMFDLASLTKVIATTNACMRLIDERKLKLNDRIVKYLPEFGKNGKSGITVYNLLVHNSGLPGWKSFYLNCQDPGSLLDSIFVSRLVYPTGQSALYSDLGFIILGKVIEKICSMPLDKFVDSVFFKPLGMKSTMYNPLPSMLHRIAPTEIDTYWEKTGEPIRGRVHDENAFILGGVSGHAGLFSTACDLAVILEMIRNGGEYDGRHYLKRSTIERFTRKQSTKSTRALGWDTKKPKHSWAGSLLSDKAFIHTGFTGTSVVVDPQRGMIIILLTNRVFPSRENDRITDVRRKVHDAVIDASK
jgi:beta-N-acetylhexosaminidase